MNLLFLTYQGDIAGSTNSIFYLTKGLAERGHNIYMGCRKKSLLYSLLEGTRVKRVPMTFKGKMDRENMRQIRDTVTRYDIQIINAQASFDRYTSILAKWFYHLDVAVIHTRRTIPSSFGLFIQNWFYTRGTDKIVAVSESVKSGLDRLGLAADHIKVIYNGTSPEKYRLDKPEKIEELKAKFGIQAGDTVIGCVSRMKKQEQILKALGKIDRKLKVIFCGINETKALRKTKERFSTNHEILYTGLIPSSEILYYYKLLRINILPTMREGLSQSLLEAMALEVPVIATSAPGNRELIKHGENGFLFTDNNIEELADQIQLLLDNEKLRARFIKNGKRTALHDFSIQKTINNYESFFKKIIAAKNKTDES